MLEQKYEDEMEAPILVSEVPKAINGLSNGKAPGQDGYTTEFYKCFSKEIAQLLIILYNDIIKRQCMPPTMRTAIISLVPKPGKDPLITKNYRPLSLLNSDYKLFAKILANRLEKSNTTFNSFRPSWLHTWTFDVQQYETAFPADA